MKKRTLCMMVALPLCAALIGSCTSPVSAEKAEEEVAAVELYGKSWSADVEELDLSGTPIPSSRELEKLASLFRNLKRMVLRDCGLSEHALMHLAERLPDCEIVWDMSIGTAVFSTDAEEIDLSGIPIKNSGTIENRLPYLTRVKKIIMSDCGLSSQEMDELNSRHEDIRFVWTVQLGRIPVRTDDTYFMPAKYQEHVETPDLADFHYCVDMECVDIGHMWVTDCEWAASMPNLTYLIVGETGISDISPLRGLQKLKYLELFTVNVQDYTPLLDCPALEDLNIGQTYGDPEIIGQLTGLKHLWWCDANGHNNFARMQQIKDLCEKLADTEIQIYMNSPTTAGWRKIPNYYAMRDALGMFYMD